MGGGTGRTGWGGEVGKGLHLTNKSGETILKREEISRIGLKLGERGAKAAADPTEANRLVLIPIEDRHLIWGHQFVSKLVFATFTWGWREVVISQICSRVFSRVG